MNYRCYLIEKEFQHYVVTAPNGTSWREDNLDDAYRAVDEDIENNCPT